MTPWYRLQYRSSQKAPCLVHRSGSGWLSHRGRARKHAFLCSAFLVWSPRRRAPYDCGIKGASGPAHPQERLIYLDAHQVLTARRLRAFSSFLFLTFSLDFLWDTLSWAGRYCRISDALLGSWCTAVDDTIHRRSDDIDHDSDRDRIA